MCHVKTDQMQAEGQTQEMKWLSSLCLCCACTCLSGPMLWHSTPCAFTYIYACIATSKKQALYNSAYTDLSHITCWAILNWGESFSFWFFISNECNILLCKWSWCKHKHKGSKCFHLLSLYQGHFHITQGFTISFAKVAQ